jgi:hypothetical protein
MRFRIGTPGTGQGTTFKKNGCPDSRAILDTKSLDIENVSE